ncbi:hypothetical protein ACSBL2_08835 [Pedobacter sp. AW31-3R]|uniref:hypothetical protein n=1 Tax=Pedobacter sp. AW31-3R TaxID=3445781 RepID=UPI003F9FFC47
MSFLLRIFFITFLTTGAIAQNKHNFGQGKIVVSWYYLPDSNCKDTSGRMWNRSTYNVAENLILRAEPNVVKLETPNNNDTTKLTAVMETPIYLIDYTSKKVIGKTYSSKKDEFKKYNLKDYNYDLFYRASLKQDTAQFQKLDTLSKHIFEINGFKCQLAIAQISGQPCRFAYTKDKIKVESPLNGLLPKFKYQVIWFESEDKNETNKPPKISQLFITEVSTGLSKPEIVELFNKLNH